MTINHAILDALGDNWLIRNDHNGMSYGGFVSAPVGEWTECPRWNAETKADCKSGGLFGQGPGGFGHAHPGSRLVFAETRGPRMSVDGDKIKVPAFRILYTGADAWAAAQYKCRGKFPGSLYLIGCTLPKGFAVGDIGGWLDLHKCTLPDGFTIGNVGGWLDLRGCTLPTGFTVGNVGGVLDLSDCILPARFAIGDVGGGLYLGGATLPEEFTIKCVGSRAFMTKALSLGW